MMKWIKFSFVSLIAIIAILGITISSNSHKILFELVPKWFETSRHQVLQFVGAHPKTFNAIDELNVKMIKREEILSSLDTFEIKIKPKHLKELEEYSKGIRQVHTMKKERKYFPISILHKKEKRKGKVTVHADTGMHADWAKKSLRIKIKKESNSLDGIRDFTLLVPHYRGMAISLYASEVAKYFNLIGVAPKLVYVKINGVGYGTFIYEEKINQGFLENREISNSYLLQISDNFRDDCVGGYFGVRNCIGHVTIFDNEISNAKEIYTGPHKDEVGAQVVRLFNHMKYYLANGLESLVDLDAFARHEAYSLLFGVNHDNAGDNLRLYYSLTSGKFSPVFRSEGDLYPLDSRPNMLHSARGQRIRIFVLLNQIPKYRKLKYKYMYQLEQNWDEVWGKLNAVKKAHELPLLVDRTIARSDWSYAQKKEILKTHLPTIERNMGHIKYMINSGHLYLNSFAQSNEIILDFLPDSRVPIGISNLKINFKNNPTPSNAVIKRVNLNGSQNTIAQVEMTNPLDLTEIFKNEELLSLMDNQLKGYRTKSRYIISPLKKFNETPKIEKIELKGTNLITKKPIAHYDVYHQSSLGPDYFKNRKSYSIEKFLKKNDWVKKYFSVKDKTLIFSEATFEIKEDLVIPQGLNVIVKAGAHFKISPGKSIISFSSVSINGTKERKVRIGSSHPINPFGSFSVVGEMSRRLNSKAQWLEIDNGSETTAEGVYLSGALNFYQSNVVMKNVSVKNSKADDGLNVKYGHVDISDSHFSENHADGIDLDFCTGQVSSSTFVGGLNNNGDGIDFSGSSILLTKNNFKEFKDKAISIGEKSRILVVSNQIEESKIGIAVKDLSEVISIENRIAANLLGFSQYRKKAHFGGSMLYSFQDHLNDNKENFSIDRFSKYKIVSNCGDQFTNDLLKAIGSPQSFSKPHFNRIHNSLQTCK